jgi:transposase
MSRITVLMERGITAPQGRRKLEQHLAVIRGAEKPRLSPRVRSLVEDMRAEWKALDRRIEAFDDEFAARAKTDDAARHLASILGIGVLNATALAAAVGNAASLSP